ncbi:Crp/Fnr family transcriptional regulator [Hufsiella ginkgonis]|uniref:Cyclic nucleotide-binding domain-containing protein n=1 Tax=Hufsiella ginkgonis TaxID=2695274 RepID=A0A7K1XU81_9SPHI|nr:Crp/Fnr family transcriptional regulator [Hufsiella ginkgonis]MXV14319.1 cyclic nucleotide-binding domain-containing protein [Hufsiella ginkgonis]
MSPLEHLLHRFSRLYPPGNPLQDFLHTHTRVYELPPRHVLLEEGTTCRKIYFIHSGFARACYFNDGKEVTAWFMGEGDVIISVYSFFTQTPGAERIELLQDSTLVSLSYERLQEAYRLFPEFNVIGRRLTEHYYILSEARAIGLRMLHAKERYNRLLDQYPSVLQNASLGQIASYLGITQETLSRIRRRK